MDKDALYAAAMAGDADAIVKLEMVDDMRQKEGETILHDESRKGNTERVRFILREFAHRNLLTKLNNDKYKDTALYCAIYWGHTEVAKILIDAARHLPVTSFQAFLRQPEHTLDTALHAAVRYGHPSIVKLLVEADPGDRHIQNDEGKTPMYTAVEKGYNDMVEIICTTCTAPSLDGPNGTTALHAAIKKLDKAKEKCNEDVIRMIIDAAKRLVDVTPPDAPQRVTFEALFNQTDESGHTVLERAVMGNHVNVVDLILKEDPAYQPGGEIKRNGLMRLIFKAIDSEYSDDIIELLSKAYEAGIDPDHKGVLALILAIKRRDQDSVLGHLRDAKNLVSFKEDNGWTPLHYVVYHEFDSVLGAIIEAQEEVGHPFVYENKVLTPFHVAVNHGYTSTLIRLMQSWPAPSSAITAANSPYTAVDEIGRNILHLAAANNKKEMVQSILKYCPEKYKDEFLKQQDTNGDTPLHLLISHGCFIPELIKHKGRLDTMPKNKNNLTPWDMLYFKNDVVADQVQIKIALDGIQIDPTRDIFSSSVLSISKRERKNVILNEQAKRMMHEKYARIKEDTRAFANCFADAIAGDPISKAALEMKADTLNESGETILHVESRKGDIENVLFIVSAFANKSLLGRLDRSKQTALHLAALHGHTQVVEALIDAARHLPSSSANDDAHNTVSSFQDFIRQANVPKRNTTLHLAVLNGNVAIVKLLVEADPNDSHVQNNEGKTPIYIAAENGYKDIVKEICTTCTALSLDGPAGRTTALHALIQNIGQVTTEEASDMIRMMVHAAKRWSSAEDPSLANFEALFSATDESGSTVLQLVVERNYVDAVELILLQDPANYPTGGKIKRNGLMRLIYKAIDNKYSNDIFELLSRAYEAGIDHDHKGVLALILDIKRRHEDSVLGHLRDAKNLVSFKEDNGWTPLHYAVYHEFDSVLGTIIEAQEEVGHPFVYENKVLTPFHVAVNHGYTSTLIRLMQSWPAPSSAVTAANSPYTVVDEIGRNILHLAAADNKKEMVQGILKYCPEKYKDEILKQQDTNGDTPLHLLIFHGCFIPELIKHKGRLDTMPKNKNNLTPWDMLYFKNDVVADQVQIKIALDGIQIDPTRDIFSSSVLSISKRERKNVILNEQAKRMMHEKYARIKEDTRAFANCFADAIAGDPISKAALEMKADTLNESGETILHVESRKGDIENVLFIVSAFANKSLLGRLDRSKQTALHLAALHGHTQVVEALIDAARHLPSSSANDDAHNTVSSFQDFIRQANVPKRNTTLHLAVLNGNVAIVKLLVEADPNDSHVQNNEGKTPIYIAAENGYKDIVKEICTTCTALSLDGPAGRTTALHALIQNIGQVTTEEASDMIRMMVHAAKRWSSAEDPSLANFEALFSATDESGSTVLQLVVERNYVDAVELILLQDPANYPTGGKIKRNGLMRLIYKAIDNKYSNDIFELLSRAYEAGIDHDHKGVLALILDIKRRHEDSVLGHLRDAKNLVSFKEDNGWTPLHYAVYHEFDSVLGTIIEAQEEVGHPFVYENKVLTPFHVAVNHGYTSTLIRLMQSWPAPSSAVTAANSPYTVVDEIGRNILHLAAADNKKEMVQGILKYCPEKYKDEILKQQDTNGDTPLHLLIFHGCFIPELIKHKGRLDTMPKNKNNFTPWDMLYLKNDVAADQVLIKIALDDVQTNQSSWNLWAKSTEKKTDIWKSIPPSKRRIKDVIFDERKKLFMDAKHDQKKKDLERYKMRTNTQIIVTALITTVTFTVGFTMPGGLYQSGDVHEGLVVLSKRSAFNVFMVSDALALLLSTSSLFFYFLESMNEDPHQVSKLNAASTVLNIVSVMAMMLTFISGTYVVLSHSPVIAITVCVIGSLFFLLIIVLLIKMVYDRQVKRNEY